jgi:signal transduction histidine kinase
LKIEEITQENSRLKKQLAEKALSDLQEAQSQLIEAERMASLGQLVGGVAHEINNPISVIKANVQIINEKIYDTIEYIPRFFETLGRKEKSFFYEIIKNSVKNNEVLSTREERERKKNILKELEEYDNLTNTSLELIADSILKIKLKPPFKKYIDIFGMKKFNKTLEMANLFVSKKNSIFSVNFAINRVSRIIFSLRTYLDTVTYQKLKTINIKEEIEKSLILYDVIKNFKIEVIRNYKDDINYTCISENLIQIFNNIIFNSIQSMYESTEKRFSVRVEKLKEIPIEYKDWRSSNENFEISIQGKSTHGFVLVEFIDTGMGISLENQEKIFTSFFTTKKLGEGIGLGLYVSKKIINEMGGIIFFQSKDGTTNFSIFLPFQT